MRDLDEIFGGEIGVRRILFEDGLWCIYTKWEDTIYVIHRCASVRLALDQEGPWECGSTQGSKGKALYGCGETAPDSIKTLYTIHRWDR